MNESPLVSVIIPVFNVEPYIEEALESVRNQTYKNLEIIVVDDGSTDGSGSVCDAFSKKDERFKVIHQENMGVSSARNTGLEIAKGEIIAFLDPDDAFQPEMIRLLLERMQKDKSDIIMCGFSEHETEEPMGMTTRIEKIGDSEILDRNEIYRRIVDQNIETAVWNKLYKRRIWKNLRFPDGYVYEGTYLIFDIFSRTNRISETSEEFVLHRIRQGSICRTYSAKNILDGDHATDHCIEFIRKHPEKFASAVARKRMKHRYRNLVGAYLQYSSRSPKDVDGQNDIKSNLVELKKKESMKHSGVLLRTGYYGLMLFPKGMKKVYSIYRKNKQKKPDRS